MRIIEIAPLDNGAHNNQSYPDFVPEGYALIRSDVELENYPFGTFEVEEVEIDEIGKVVCMKEDTWTPLPLPEPEPEQEPEPSQLDIIEAQVTYTAMMTDTLLEV